MPGPDPDGPSSAPEKKSRMKQGLSAAGSSLSRMSSSEEDRASSERVTPVQYKRGGKVRKTGIAKLHKNERVIPVGKVKRVEKMMKRSKMRMKARG
jgi:hypothetical protein